MISYAALSPHPPIIIPEVGGERIGDVYATIEAMQSMAEELLATSPDTVLFLTPHGNVFADCVSCLIEPELVGNLESFGQPNVGTSHPNDLNLVREIENGARKRGISILGIDQELAARHGLNAQIDHGIMVPLYYLEKAGMQDKPIVAISVGYLDTSELYALGKIIQEAAYTLNKRVAVLASGDMSHRLKDEGPYNYHPDGMLFDLKIKDLLVQNDVQGIMNIPESLRKNAGECAYLPIVIMLGTFDCYHFKSRVFSYEGPFGVGYLVAGLKPGKPTPSILEKIERKKMDGIKARRLAESMPVKWARLTLETYLERGQKPDLPAEMDQLLRDRAGAFVSIKKNGQLRGCIGTFQPAYKNLAEEIKNNALAAALNDPRFPAIKATELSSLVYSVDILAQPESCERIDLNPKIYGVIVNCGARRGLLLPDLEGVDTVEQQLQIALQKAGISPHEKYSIQRFEVKRFK